jgi:hypothetical protein
MESATVRKGCEVAVVRRRREVVVARCGTRGWCAADGGARPALAVDPVDDDTELQWLPPPPPPPRRRWRWGVGCDLRQRPWAMGLHPCPPQPPARSCVAHTRGRMRSRVATQRACTGLQISREVELLGSRNGGYAHGRNQGRVEMEEPRRRRGELRRGRGVEEPVAASVWAGRGSRSLPGGGSGVGATDGAILAQRLHVLNLPPPVPVAASPLGFVTVEEIHR